MTATRTPLKYLLPRKLSRMVQAFLAVSRFPCKALVGPPLRSAFSTFQQLGTHIHDVGFKQDYWQTSGSVGKLFSYSLAEKKKGWDHWGIEMPGHECKGQWSE